jgi:hypothetical protein
VSVPSLLATGIRYRSGLAELVDAELDRWASLAQEIADPHLRALARAKLEEEGRNARAASLLATQAPRPNRSGVARTIVAAEVLYDYLDGRTERVDDGCDPLEARRGFYEIFTAAFTIRRLPSIADAPDERYLRELAETVTVGLAGLPGINLVRGQLDLVAKRAAEAQSRAHAADAIGLGCLEGWARGACVESGLGWREYAAGSAASILSAHALTVRAAQDSGPSPQEIDGAYLALAALATLLDALEDQHRDEREGLPGYAGLFADDQQLGASLRELLSRTAELTHALGPIHATALNGLLAHYKGTEHTATTHLSLGQRTAIALARLLLRDGTRRAQPAREP